MKALFIGGIMKVALITSEDSQTDYSQLSHHSQDLILAFKTPEQFFFDRSPYDFVILEEQLFGEEYGLQKFKTKVSFDRIFLILEESKANQVDTYLMMGIRDVFVLPINFMELATKLKHAADLKKSSLFANTQAGMSLKQILIFEVLRMNGPQGAGRDQLLKEIWGNDKVESKNVDVHIHNLRKILKKQGKEITWRQDRWFLTG